MATQAQHNDLSVLEISIQGLERAGFLPPINNETSRPTTSNGQDQNRLRPDARVASYFNHFPTRTAPSFDAPPSYNYAAARPHIAHEQDGLESLPAYDCTVLKGGHMCMMQESCSPFVNVPFPEWREVFVEVRGTQVALYRLKGSTKTPGKVIRTYTLQQAEVGLATDVNHNVLIPATRLAALIPAVARRKAFARDPQMFTVEKHYALRLRAEMDQIVLTTPNEQQMFSWVNYIAAGIDIAPPIDNRSAPRQCTIPRRRRRARQAEGANINDEAFVAQQERIMRSLYPRLATDGEQTSEDQATSTPPRASTPMVRLTGPDQDGEDVDLSALAEDSPRPERSLSRSSIERPTASRMTNCTQFSATAMEMSAPVIVNIDPVSGKWNPPHPRSSSQQLRYIRRCMPALTAETPRHSSVMVFKDKYVRPNYRMLVLEEWTLQPPSYDAHKFSDQTSSDTMNVVARSISASEQNSTDGSAIQRTDSPLHDPTIDVRHIHDQYAFKHIDRVDTALQGLEKTTPTANIGPNILGIGF